MPLSLGRIWSICGCCQNRHLLHVMRAVPAAALANTISIGGREPVTLGFVIDDYLGHLQHHLEQIL